MFEAARSAPDADNETIDRIEEAWFEKEMGLPAGSFKKNYELDEVYSKGPYNFTLKKKK